MFVGCFYLCGYKHSFTFFQFPSHRKRFNLFYVKDMRLCWPPSLGISLESNKVPLVHTFFSMSRFRHSILLLVFVWMVHYQLENADECITMWSKCRYLLIIVSHCNYIIKDIHCFTCLVCQWIPDPMRFLHFFLVICCDEMHNNVINFKRYVRFGIIFVWTLISVKMISRTLFYRKRKECFGYIVLTAEYLHVEANTFLQEIPWCNSTICQQIFCKDTLEKRWISWIAKSWFNAVP